ncbi:elongation factor G [bacterium]|nr:elongation factor G [bacterium]
MKKYDTANIRNIALIGGKGVGKTSLVEGMLYTAKATTRLGRVDEGTTIMDYDPLEVERKQTINSKVVPCEWKDCKINIIDTPGYADFIGEAVSSIWVSDVSMIVVDGIGGVDVSTKRMYDYVQKFKRAGAFFINKMDNERTDIDKVMDSIKKVLTSSATLLQIPIVDGGFKGVVDLINMKAYLDGKEVDIPENLKAEADSKRMELMESVAENDEALLEKYLEAGEISEDEMKNGLAKGIANSQIFPVFVGSAYEDKGIDAFLNAIVDILPSPIHSMIPEATKGEEKVELKVDSNAPLAALVFKMSSDPGIGDIFFFRMYSGSISSGDDVFNVNERTNERFGHAFVMKGKDRIEIDGVVAGDIAAIAKLKVTSINNTLATKDNQIKFGDMTFPNPVVPMAIKPKTKKDSDKMGGALSKLTSLDRTIKYHVDREFGETVITGMGDIHIDIMVKRLKDRYGVEIEMGKPRIPYRETITRKAEVQGKHKKQSGGHGQFGDCWIRLEPMPMEKEFEFVNAITGGSIPSKYLPAVEKGIKEAMKKGVLAGYPVVGIRATCFDGSYHDVDSSDMSFQIAGSMAFKKAQEAASPHLLEPILKVETTVPSDFVGDVTSDFSSRRGKVSSMDHIGDMGVVKATVPMSEMDNYSAAVKSITSGAGTFTMVFSHYEPVPPHMAQKIVDEAKKAQEEQK